MSKKCAHTSRSMIPENRRPCFCILLARGSAGPKKNHPTNTKTQKSHTHALGRCHGCYCWSVRLLARGSACPKKNLPTNTKTQKSHTHIRTWFLPRLLLLVCTTTGKGVCWPKKKPSDQYQDTKVTHTHTHLVAATAAIAGLYDYWQGGLLAQRKTFQPIPRHKSHTRTWLLPRLLLLVCTTTGMGVCLPKETPSDQYQDKKVTHTHLVAATAAVAGLYDYWQGGLLAQRKTFRPIPRHNSHTHTHLVAATAAVAGPYYYWHGGLLAQRKTFRPIPRHNSHTRTWLLPRLLLLVCTTTGKGGCLVNNGCCLAACCCSWY